MSSVDKTHPSAITSSDVFLVGLDTTTLQAALVTNQVSMQPDYVLQVLPNLGLIVQIL